MSEEVTAAPSVGAGPAPEPQLVKEGEGRFILEGQECTQIYFHTEKIVFSVSTLLPGQRACVDRGHTDAHEIVYVSQAALVLHLTGIDRFYRLHKGDALLIPPGEPHYSVNVGTELSVAVWACAPHL